MLHNPCKDQTYSHNLYFRITGLARRFNPETVLRQDTLLLYNPKECRGKNVCPFFLLENSRPLSPCRPLDFLSTYLGNDSLEGYLPSTPLEGARDLALPVSLLRQRHWFWPGRLFGTLPGVLTPLGSPQHGRRVRADKNCVSFVSLLSSLASSVMSWLL